MKDREFRRSSEELQKTLTPEQFRVTQLKGTERPFTGAYWNVKDKGVYRCAVCGNELFSSKAKYDSHTGWPSFWEPFAPDKPPDSTS